MKGLSSIANAAILAQAEALAGPYADIAGKLARASDTAKTDTKTAKDSRSTLWNLLKSAIPLSRTIGHNAETMRAGLEVACLQAEVPTGSWRGYIGTIQNLAADTRLTAADIDTISVKDARVRYMAADAKALQAARAKLAEVTKGWTAEQLLILCDLASGDTSETVQDVAQAA